MNQRDTPHHLLLDPSDQSGLPPSSPPQDELDALLREWHQDNAHRAAAGRDRLIAALASSQRQTRPAGHDPWQVTVRRISIRAIVPLAAAAAVALVVLPILRPGSVAPPSTVSGTSPFGASAAVAASPPEVRLAPEAGRLDAFDRGEAIGPCVLGKTDIRAEVSGPFARVTLTQNFRNVHPHAIDAVYTLPLANTAAVDRMSVSVSDRLIVAQAREREDARDSFERARTTGRVASLLERSRPNILTHSLAHIEPGADIQVQVSYVEQLTRNGGEFEFTLPVSLTPRYAASESPSPSAASLPPGWSPRRGINLLAPAELVPIPTIRPGSGDPVGSASGDLLDRIARAVPIAAASRETAAPDDTPLAEFDAVYPDGSRERGRLYKNDLGEINGRWFQLGPPPSAENPPASSPAPVKADPAPTPPPHLPAVRPGHELSVTVAIDTGGPGIIDLKPGVHKVIRQDTTTRPDGLASRATVTLVDADELPNRDFVLTWRASAMTIEESVLTAPPTDGSGEMHFAVVLQPPARTPPASAVSRELLLVLDTDDAPDSPALTSAESLTRRLIGSLRPQDTLNIIDLLDGRTLWPAARAATPDDSAAAIAFLRERPVRLAAEAPMALAVLDAALQPAQPRVPEIITTERLAATPADGRELTVRIPDAQLDSDGLSAPPESALVNGRILFRPDTDPADSARIVDLRLPLPYMKKAERHLRDDIELALNVRGRWVTESGERLFKANAAELADAPPVRPLRIAVLMTDGTAMSHPGIIEVIRRHRESTRLVAHAIDPSVDQSLLDAVTRAGRGATSAAVGATSPEERLVRSCSTPVLTHLSAKGSPEIDGSAFEPPLDQLPDLFDAQPVVILGRCSSSSGGTLTLRGQTAGGPWERRMTLPPAGTSASSVVPHLWARARIDRLAADLAVASRHAADDTSALAIRAEIVALGESFGLASPFTSLVAVDHQRVTIDGLSRLAPIPRELPDQTPWDEFLVTKGRTGPAPAAPFPGNRTTLRSATPGAPAAAAGAADRPPHPGERKSVIRADSRPDGREEPATVHITQAPTGPARITFAHADATPVSFDPNSPALVGTGADAGASMRASVTGSPEHPIAGRDAGSAAATVAAPMEQAAEGGRDLVRDQEAIADEFFNGLTAQLEAVAARGQPPPDRFAAVAAANFIAVNTQARQYVAANRAAELFVPAYPGEPLLQAAAAAATPRRDGHAKDSAEADSTAAKSTRARGAQGPAPEQSARTDETAPSSSADGGGVNIQALVERTSQAAEQERELILRLDQRLYQLLPAPGQVARPNRAEGRGEQRQVRMLQRQDFPRQALAQQQTPTGVELIVSILMDATDEPTLAELRACGVRIESTLADSNTVVGRIRISDLAKAALCRGVRRIEPVVEPGT